MCGFILSINDDCVDIYQLTESIKHRGPDSTKYYVAPRIQCGFNRLAIVDNDSYSDQPMLDTSGRYLMVFNGEIYNHNKLRLELEKNHSINFRTHSDTEVLLNGLKYEGIDYISKLDGIFAFAFVDLESLDIVLARDLFGVKPIYYYSKANKLYISSEIKPLLQISESKLAIANIAKFMSYGTIGNEGTLVSDVNGLEPNTIKILSLNKKHHTAKIHRIEYDLYETLEFDEISTTLYQTIQDQKPNIPYGVMFSGGLDSTLILNKCYEDENFFGAYSVNVDHCDMSEKHWQEYVVDKLKMREQYRRVDLKQSDFSLESIANIARGLDCPLFHPNFIGSYLLSRKASEDGLKVLLSGEGADELFLGYRWFFSDQPVSAFLEYVPLQDIQNILGAKKILPLCTHKMNLLEIFQKIYLQRWLIRQDLTGMANSVEIRVPFLGLELAKLMNKLSFHFKKGNNKNKWIIKKLLSGNFSNEFLERKKVGFDFPLNDWITLEHIDFLRKKTNLIDIDMFNAMLHQYEGSYFKNRIIFSLVSFVLWSDNLLEPRAAFSFKKSQNQFLYS